MDAFKLSALSRPSRREFMLALGGLGAATLLPGSSSSQNAAGRRIDVHQHFVSPDYLAVLRSKPMGTVAAQVANTFREYSPQRQIEQMDQVGIATALVSPTAPAAWFGNVEEARKISREMNEFAIAKMKDAYKGRFGVFATLPMPDVEGTLREIAYAYDTLKVDGVSFLTSYDNKYLGDASFAPIWEELNRRNAVVYTHPLESACCKNPVQGVSPQTLEYPTDTTRTLMSIVASETATKSPNVKIIFSHAGGTLVSIAQRFLGNQVTPQGLAQPIEPNSRYHHVRRFYYDTAGSANPIQLQSLKLLVPVTQIVFGSDYPFGGQLANTVNGVDNSRFTPEELRGIHRENAAKFLPQFA